MQLIFIVYGFWVNCIAKVQDNLAYIAFLGKCAVFLQDNGPFFGMSGK